ncbi:MAG: hypothetical protein ACXWAV_07980 [Chthoniobacterales bacterium]
MTQPTKTTKCIAVFLALTLSLAVAAPNARSTGREQLRPLNFENVVSFFHDSLGKAPLTTAARTAVFTEGEWKNRNIYNHSLIFIDNADEDLQITFIMSGDEGMNWVNEFFDSRFFQRAETESLFALFNSVHGSRKTNIGRFAVEMSRWQPHHHEIVVLSLTPRR